MEAAGRCERKERMEAVGLRAEDGAEKRAEPAFASSAAALSDWLAKYEVDAEDAARPDDRNGWSRARAMVSMSDF